MSDADLEPKWWKKAAELAGVGIFSVDKHFDTSYSNSRMAEMLGFPFEEMIGKNLLSFIPEDSTEAMTRQLENKGRDASLVYEFQFLRKDGSTISTVVSSDCVFESDGKFERGTFIVLDVTGQKRTERFLKASRNSLRTILDAIAVCLSPVDKEDRIGELMNRIKQLLESDIQIGTVQESQQVLEELNLHTEHAKELLEERIQELLKAERLAAVGQAAAMIAHDLRNPLQDIRLAQYLLRKHYPHEQEDELKKLLTQIDRNIAYADGVVDSLLIYSQEGPLNCKETDINQLLKESLIESAPPEHVKVEENLREVPSVYVDQNQMKRVFQNLILNAFQDMELGGTLILETKLAGNQVEVSVQDTGEGISEIKKNLIWKPFYTSKPKGMGLGLSIAKRVAEMHGGTIRLESKPGKGSTFTVAIPMSKPNEAASSSSRNSHVG